MSVTSSMMTDADYDTASAEMTIRFVDGDRYTYLGVPPAVFQGLLDAPSKGRYFHAVIRDRYRYLH